MTFDVTSAMPYLLVKFQNFSKTLLSGEIKRLTVQITNRGKMGLKNLRVALTYERMEGEGRGEKRED